MKPSSQPSHALRWLVLIAIFLLVPIIRADITFSNLYNLTGYTDATLVQGTNGLLYGTTVGYVEHPIVETDYGAIFSATTSPVRVTEGGISALENVKSNILVFNGKTGGHPSAGVILDGPNVFATTAFSGTSNTLFSNGMGTITGIIYNGKPVTPPFENPVLFEYQFGKVQNAKGQPMDGASPRAPLLAGPNHIFYGTTYHGGTNGYASNGLGYGTVFKWVTNSTVSVLTSLHSFTGADGANPGGLVFGSDTNLYSVTSYGGANTNVVDTNGDAGFGTIYQITTNGTLTMLYSFGTVTNSNGVALDGAQPNILMQGSDGAFYGTTVAGGSNNMGTVFQLTTNGSFASLYSFGAISNSHGIALDGSNPSGPLIEGADGNYYGTTQFGGVTNTGTIFRITPNGLLTTLFSFSPTNAQIFPPAYNPPVNPLFKIISGVYPKGGLMVGADGYFYGTTYSGSAYLFPSEEDYGGQGTVFKIGPPTPTILDLPASITLPAGATQTLSASVRSLYPLTLQWQFNATNIPNATSTNLTLDNITFSNAGTYTLIASNLLGSTNASEVVSVVPAIITTQPQSLTVPSGSIDTFAVTVTTFYPVTYQWEFHGTILEDATNSFFTFGPALAANEGYYFVVISNTAGVVISSDADLSVLPPPPPSVQTAIQTNNTINFVWSAVAGQTYQVQFTTNLVGGSWLDLGDPVSASGAALSLSDAISNDQRFYRIILLPSP